MRTIRERARGRNKKHRIQTAVGLPTRKERAEGRSERRIAPAMQQDAIISYEQ